MIVAKIAMEELFRKDPKIVSEVNKDLHVLSPWSKEDKYFPVEAATWADDIKALGWTAFNHWHFDNIPIIEKDWHGKTH